MRHSGHARYYERLTPEERFRLDVLAMARGIRRSQSSSPGRAPDATTR
jgi:hypothetical protein